jgi:hypothetical protein
MSSLEINTKKRVLLRLKHTFKSDLQACPAIHAFQCGASENVNVRDDRRRGTRSSDSIRTRFALSLRFVGCQSWKRPLD